MAWVPESLRQWVNQAEVNVGRRPGFTATRPEAIWVSDFTYWSTWSRIAYVAFVVDVFSLRIEGWKAARTMATSLVTDSHARTLGCPPGSGGRWGTLTTDAIFTRITGDQGDPGRLRGPRTYGMAAEAIAPGKMRLD